MRKFITFLLILVSILVIAPFASAQMMGNGNYIMQGQVSVTPSAQDLQDIQIGKDLYTKFQNNKVSCSNLKDDDFEKIGEYLMEQRFGNTNAHIQMNERAKQMMGDQGEERMHIMIARSATGCYNANQKGGVFPMMGWGGYGYGNMMYGNFGWGFGFVHLFIALVILIDLILAGMWLWKQVKKK